MTESGRTLTWRRDEGLDLVVLEHEEELDSVAHVGEEQARVVRVLVPATRHPAANAQQ